MEPIPLRAILADGLRDDLQVYGLASPCCWIDMGTYPEQEHLLLLERAMTPIIGVPDRVLGSSFNYTWTMPSSKRV